MKTKLLIPLLLIACENPSRIYGTNQSIFDHDSGPTIEHDARPVSNTVRDSGIVYGGRDSGNPVDNPDSGTVVSSDSGNEPRDSGNTPYDSGSPDMCVANLYDVPTGSWLYGVSMLCSQCEAIAPPFCIIIIQKS